MVAGQPEMSQRPLPVDLKVNWDRPPFNRWAFQHVREVLPTAEVWRGSSPVRVLPQRVQNLDDLQVAGGVKLSKFLEDTETDGFVILHDGAVAYERYLNDMTPRSLHLSQSVAKSVVGMTAGIMVEQGLLDLARPVTHYLPELEVTAW